jgi:hypothetical protein
MHHILAVRSTPNDRPSLGPIFSGSIYPPKTNSLAAVEEHSVNGTFLSQAKEYNPAAPLPTRDLERRVIKRIVWIALALFALIGSFMFQRIEQDRIAEREYKHAIAERAVCLLAFDADRADGGQRWLTEWHSDCEGEIKAWARKYPRQARAKTAERLLSEP